MGVTDEFFDFGLESMYMDLRNKTAPGFDLQYESLVRAALIEDIGPGDLTTSLCLPIHVFCSAAIVAKSPGTIAGLAMAAMAFRLLDPGAMWESCVSDGDVVNGNSTRIATVSGDARALLTAERVALNFLQRLSGIATLTAAYVARTAGTRARIADTRKTTPGLRSLEKYAVRVGGGYNHRLGLYDAVLIKDNHIRAAGGITAAVQAVRAGAPHTVKIEVEATTLEQVDEALAARADIIMLDNMSMETMRQAVVRIDRRALTEASGGLTLERVEEIAAVGVDILSVGALTHSAPAMDISLDFES